MTDKHRVPLVLVSGLATAASRCLADRLVGDSRTTALVHHDLRLASEGFLRRYVSLGDHDSLETVQLDHDCVSCTLRRDLLPLLRSLARTPEVERIVVRLDEALEPEQVCQEIHTTVVGEAPVTDDVEIEAVATVVDQATWLADVTGDAPLRERGLQAGPDDDRTLAQVAAVQPEFADVLVLAGEAPDAWTAARTGAVLERLAPRAAILELCRTDTPRLGEAVPGNGFRGTPRDPGGAVLSGEPPLEPDCGVSLLSFTARRPFHPDRLNRALDTLLDGVVRTRGHAWIASRPDERLWVESAGGGLGLRLAGQWLDADTGPAWDDVSPERRAIASLRWHPRWGDRAQELVVLADRADPAAVEHELRAALLTDDELAEGADAWRRYPDPFVPATARKPTPATPPQNNPAPNNPAPTPVRPTRHSRRNDETRHPSRLPPGGVPGRQHR
ncbi:ribosome hibernation factor-recruiting GTPase MRF [Saccharomonospora sp. CUA-673]|uniref:ribosome hibernation factor-recruiting GTPase MRF n=1 Tax=Saccharomonospora sp. CUA-673 TaxID=1904969 RepID=UPI00111516BD|nr:GTP-binding protein [Saccharomonospora sp. CUA-673]